MNARDVAFVLGILLIVATLFGGIAGIADPHLKSRADKAKIVVYFAAAIITFAILVVNYGRDQRSAAQQSSQRKEDKKFQDRSIGSTEAILDTSNEILRHVVPSNDDDKFRRAKRRDIAHVSLDAVNRLHRKHETLQWAGNENMQQQLAAELTEMAEAMALNWQTEQIYFDDETQKQYEELLAFSSFKLSYPEHNNVAPPDVIQLWYQKVANVRRLFSAYLE
jgi:hypothetical protein